MKNNILQRLTAFTLTLGLSLTALHPVYANTTKIEKNLQANYPDVKVESITQSPLKGIYEVYMGGRMIYTNEDAQYVLVGDLLDLKNKKNLTHEHEQKFQGINIADLPLEQAIKHVRGNGQRKLYLFSDPLCSYCQQLEQQMTSVQDVTVYLFLLPLRNIHPQSEEIATRIWCSPQQFEAWEDFVLHRQVPKASNQCKNPIEANITLAERLEIDGTPAYFLENGERLFGLRTADQMNEALNQAMAQK